MDAKEKLAERKKMFDNAFAFEHNKRVPTISNFWTWPILDAGYTFKEAMYDYDVMEKINDEFVNRYQFDCYFDFLTRNPFKVTEALGGGVHQISESGDQIYALDTFKLKREEYREFIDDPDRVYWEKIFQRYCKPDLTLGELRKALEEFFIFGDYSSRMLHKYVETDGALNYYGVVCQPPFETLFDMLRGIKEISVDLRKVDHGLLKEVMDHLWATDLEPYLMSTVESEDREGYIAPITFIHLGTSILNTKQFEELYWPYMKKIIDVAAAHGKKVSVLCESASCVSPITSRRSRKAS